jgi:2-oxoacid:acceptor oxidoreductase gamma subunit (pyruvate/2-ketoisovalerate family)
MEIRLHGRGGQGAASASGMLVAAFSEEDKYACGFPMFGFERRGAPVTTFARFSDKPITEKTMIYHPDCLVVLDTSQLTAPNVYAGFQKNGILIANINHVPEEKFHENLKTLGIVDATKIAIEEIGMPAINTCILGSFAATTKWLKLETLTKIMPNYFKGKILERNLKSLERGYNETQVIEYD